MSKLTSLGTSDSGSLDLVASTPDTNVVHTDTAAARIKAQSIRFHHESSLSSELEEASERDGGSDTSDDDGDGDEGRAVVTA